MGDGRRIGGLLTLGIAAAGTAAWRWHQATLERLRTAIRHEREWSRRLRDQLHLTQLERGPVAERDDPRELVLRTAIELLGARKGVLLSRSDADGDGDFDLVAVHGFAGDPEHLPVVQRFTGLVLECDQMLVEDDVPDDSEIDNLVAVPVYMFDRFQGVVVCANRPGGFSAVDDNVLLALGDHAGAALDAQRVQGDLRESRRAAVRMLCELIAAADPDRAAAAVEGTALAAALARRLGLEPTERDNVVCAAALRDVGLLAVPDVILAKAGPLTPAERAVVQRHAQIGFEVIGQMRELRDIAFGVLYHHERHDGTGYPAGLAGESIPLSARIVAVIDAFCAITRERPHRPARGGAVAVGELIEQAGSQFDPEIVAAFVEEMENPQLRSVDAGTTEAAMEWLLMPDRPAAAGAPAALAGGIDGLTGLATHRAFREDVATAAREEEALAVVLVELPELAAVNERDGYAAGDRQIATVARRLQRVGARAGLVAYRDGGRRFGLIARGPEAAHATRLLDDINTEFALGPPVRVALASGQAGQPGDTVIAAARLQLQAALISPNTDLDKVE
jgi:GGDEF domain-containing protein